jgi:hypothetical protein
MCYKVVGLATWWENAQDREGWRAAIKGYSAG